MKAVSSSSEGIECFVFIQIPPTGTASESFARSASGAAGAFMGSLAVDRLEMGERKLER